MRERREETSNREVSFLSSSDNFTEFFFANSLEPFDFFWEFPAVFKDLLKKAPRSELLEIIAKVVNASNSNNSSRRKRRTRSRLVSFVDVTGTL